MRTVNFAQFTIIGTLWDGLGLRTMQYGLDCKLSLLTWAME